MLATYSCKYWKSGKHAQEFHGFTPLLSGNLQQEWVASLARNTQLVVLANAEHGFGYGTETPEQKESIKRIEAFFDSTKLFIQ